MLTHYPELIPDLGLDFGDHLYSAFWSWLSASPPPPVSSSLPPIRARLPHPPSPPGFDSVHHPLLFPPSSFSSNPLSGFSLETDSTSLPFTFSFPTPAVCLTVSAASGPFVAPPLCSSLPASHLGDGVSQVLPAGTGVVDPSPVSHLPSPSVQASLPLGSTAPASSFPSIALPCNFLRLCLLVSLLFRLSLLTILLFLLGLMLALPMMFLLTTPLLSTLWQSRFPTYVGVLLLNFPCCQGA